MTASRPTTAAAEGAAWSAGASGWAQYWAGFAAPAREAVEADLRVGPIEELPWPDHSFGLVTGFNAFQFAADFVTALSEARRVARPGGRVAIRNWGRVEDREVHAIFAPLSERKPRPSGAAAHDPPTVGEPGVLEALARRAGLTPERAEEVEVPYWFPDRATLERALLAIAPVYRIAPEVAERVVRGTVEVAAEPFRRPDGSYRFENRFRYLIAAA